ncbi:winged helix-turn-helix transcriptional regulator [Aquimarina celericrescens]|uniref:Winged helix-turn-helix transcriptional regulator n=1 Tax=Aquimarina celericrescens TaxID=1964542 RepID=A0ABW5AXW9_9FLAO|nr:helix-turn-helix transcriptional regulator [Aquimarina celericrescens]
MLEYKDKHYYCPVELTMDLVGGKWKGVIIWYLKDSTMRYNELKKKITTISEKVLIKELRSLESDGIVSRKVYPEVPPKVEYSLTPYGKTLIPIFELISKWGNKHVELYGTLKE